MGQPIIEYHKDESGLYLPDYSEFSKDKTGLMLPTAMARHEHPRQNSLVKRLASWIAPIGLVGAALASQYSEKANALEVTVPVTDNANQNALNWQIAAQTSVPSTDTLTIILPNAIYDLNGTNAIRLNWQSNITHKSLTNPIPADVLTYKDFPTTGTIIRDELDLAANATLENLIFDGRGSDAPYNFVKPTEPGVIIKNCFAVGNKTTHPNYRAFETVISGESFNILGGYIDNFTYGIVGDNIGSKFRNLTVKNCLTAAIMNASADWGTELDQGGNLFVLAPQGQLAATPTFAIITGGTGFPLQLNYWYKDNGDGTYTQFKTLAEVTPYINDKRTTSGIKPARVKLQGIGSDVLILPMKIDPHPSEPIPASVNRNLWTYYQ